MSLFKFLKDAGEKVLGSNVINAAEGILGHMQSKQIGAEGVKVDVANGGAEVKLSGKVADAAAREKAILAAGNVNGVESVDASALEIEGPPAEASTFYTVVKGDTLSKIAKAHYGNANAYMRIFEANKPLLSHPDKIYPGQVLRIPAKD